MAEVIEFHSVKDRVRAIEVLEAVDEGYTRVPPNSRFIVSSRATKILEEKNIHFTVLGTKKVAVHG